MSEIIALAGLFLASLQGAYPVNFWSLAEEWMSRPTKLTLWRAYAFCAFNIALLNVVILFCRACIKYGGGSFFPTYLNRTPGEWIMGAIGASFIMFLGGCFVVRDQWLIKIGEFKPGLLELFKRWKWFYIIDLTIMLGSYAYQVYFYGWWPWY